MMRHAKELMKSPLSVKPFSPKPMNWFDICNYSFWVVLSLLFVFPFWQLIVLSFSAGNQATSLGLRLWTDTWSTEAYKFVFSYSDVTRPFLNSIMRTVIGTTLEVLFTIFAAYPLAKKALPYRGWLTTYFIIPMFFSGGLIPYYLLMRSIGMVDNFLVLIIPGAVSVFSIIIVRNYFMSLDVALEESAVIDGAGYVTLLLKIVVPVSTPVLATVGLWAAVGHWNAWFDAMIFMRNKDLTVIQVIIREMLMGAGEPSRDIQNAVELSLVNVRSTIALLAIGPIVLFYPWLQRYFVKGIMLGSLKG